MYLKKKDIKKVLKNIFHQISTIDKAIVKKKLVFKNKSKKEIDPVTFFDILVEKKIKSIIQKIFPDHEIIGEETKNKNKANKSSYSWYIDPIDGTKALIMGLPNWSNLIGLHYNSKPILSFAYFPVLQKLYYTDEKNSYLKIGKKISKIRSSKKK